MFAERGWAAWPPCRSTGGGAPAPSQKLATLGGHTGLLGDELSPGICASPPHRVSPVGAARRILLGAQCHFSPLYHPPAGAMGKRNSPKSIPKPRFPPRGWRAACSGWISRAPRYRRRRLVTVSGIRARGASGGVSCAIGALRPGTNDLRPIGATP